MSACECMTAAASDPIFSLHIRIVKLTKQPESAAAATDDDTHRVRVWWRRFD